MTDSEFLELKKGDKVLLRNGDHNVRAKILNIRTDSHDGISQDLRAKVSYGCSKCTAIRFYVKPEEIICKIEE